MASAKDFINSLTEAEEEKRPNGGSASATAAGSIDVPLAIVEKFSPVIKFHADEPFLPCTIEHILQNGALRDVSPTLIEGQHTSRPALAAMGDKLYMVYTDSNSSQLYWTWSTDGLRWDNVGQIPGQHTNVPALASFNGRLWMAYTDANSSEIWVTSSADGENWENTHRIGQETDIPALAVFNNKLWMAYSDSSGSDIWVTSSADGMTWSHTHKIGQNTSVPALVGFNGRLWMIYRDSQEDCDDFFITSTADGDNWGNTHRMGLTTTNPPRDAVPALAAFKGRIWMVYTQRSQSDIVVTSSADGQNWTPPHSIGPNLQTTVPALAVFNGWLCMTYTAPHSSQLWAARSADGDNWTRPAISAVTQHGLATHYNDGYYIDINESQYAGEGLTAPQYYAVQKVPEGIEITYLIICAYNGHQTVSISGIGYAILDNFARHPGDLERVTIRLDDKLENILGATFESHGNATYFAANALAFEGTHAQVYSSLNAHGTFNPPTDGGWHVDSTTDAKVVKIEFGDAVGNCGEEGKSVQIWTPSEYRRVGLTDQGEPVNEQIWAKFQGRIGGHVDNSLHGGRNFGGSGLSAAHWRTIDGFFGAAETFGLLPDEVKYGDGPQGLNNPVRSYMWPTPRK